MYLQGKHQAGINHAWKELLYLRRVGTSKRTLRLWLSEHGTDEQDGGREEMISWIAFICV